MPGPSWLAGTDPTLNNPLAKFIQEREGWTPGSRSHVNNNPGNLMYAKQPGSVGTDEKGFAKFPDYKTGLAALNKQIQLDASRGLTFRQFAAKYAPKSDGNDPEDYAKSLAASTGRGMDDPISSVVAADSGKPSWLKGASGSPGHTQSENGTPVVQPASTFQYIGNVLHRGVDGALRGVGLPDTADPAWHNPIRASDIPAALNPWNLIKGASDTQVAEAQKGADAIAKVGTAQGIANKVGAAGGAVAHGIATLLPPLSPAADAYDRMGRGDVAGGLMQGVTNVAGGDLIRRAGAEAAGRVSGESPVPSEPVSGKYPLAPTPPTPEEANFQRSAKPFLEATKPGPLTPKVTDALRTALPEYKAQEPAVGPITTKNRSIAGERAEAKYNQTFHNYLDPAIDRGDTFDGNVIANEKMDAIPSSLRPDPLDDPENPAIQAKQKQYQRMVDEANSFRRPFDANTLYQRLQENNAEAQKFHDMNGDQQYAAEIAGRPLAQVNAEGVGMRKALYQGIDPNSQGKNISESQGRYSDLITIRQHLDRLDNNVAQQNTPTTTQKFVTAGSDALGLLTGQGANIVKRRATEPDTLSDKVATAFKSYKGKPLPVIPDPPALVTPPKATPNTDFTLRSPNGGGQFTVQRALFGGDIPSYQEGSDVGTPKQKLTPTDPKTFDWQRALFPQMDERPVAPPPVNP